MLIEERHRAILDILNETGRITTSIIQRQFSVGYGTAVRDLDILEEKGLLKRTHGGAVPARQVGYNPNIGKMTSKERCENVREDYLSIAKCAIEQIKDDDVIYITSASVGYLMAREIGEKRCTVVTNSSSVAEELRGKFGLRVILTGGEMDANGNFYDDFTLSAINRLRFDKCFITAASCSKKFGLSIQSSRSISLTKAVIENSRRVIGLFPSEKLGTDSVLQICPISALDALITDSGAAEETINELKEGELEVITAK